MQPEICFQILLAWAWQQASSSFQVKKWQRNPSRALMQVAGLFRKDPIQFGGFAFPKTKSHFATSCPLWENRGGIFKRSLHKKLKKKRQEIDAIDLQILQLLAQRFERSGEIAKLKKEDGGLGIFQPEREAEILRRALAFGKRFSIGTDCLQAIFKQIFQESRRQQGEICKERKAQS